MGFSGIKCPDIKEVSDVSTRIVDVIVDDVSFSLSKQQKKKELVFATREVTKGAAWYPRISFSDKLIDKEGNENNKKSMDFVSSKRFGQLLGVEPSRKALVPVIDQLIGREARIKLETRVNPESGVEQEEAQAIYFEGERMPSISAEEWAKD